MTLKADIFVEDTAEND